MVNFSGFNNGVIGKPLPANAYSNAVNTSKCNSCPIMQAAKKVGCEKPQEV